MSKHEQEDFRLERAIEVAAIAHSGQLDKGGEPYILHALRVMLGCPPGVAQIVGVLHDVVEDTAWSLDTLREDFSDEVVDAVEALTRLDGETYGQYISRVSSVPLACTVKRADLRDNLILSRIPHPTDYDFQRWDKYRRALRKLEAGSAGPRTPEEG